LFHRRHLADDDQARLPELGADPVEVAGCLQKPLSELAERWLFVHMLLVMRLLVMLDQPVAAAGSLW
jgi:hypothetical protein